MENDKREELIANIARQLWAEDVLDPNNFATYDNHITYVKDVIRKCLDGYLLVQGEIL